MWHQLQMFIIQCISALSFGGSGLVQNHPLRVQQKISIEDTHIQFSKIIADTRSAGNPGCHWPGVFVAEFIITKGFNKKKVLLGFRGGEPVRVNGPFNPTQVDYKPGTTTVGDMEYQVIFVKPEKPSQRKTPSKNYVVSLLVKR